MNVADVFIRLAITGVECADAVAYDGKLTTEEIIKIGMDESRFTSEEVSKYASFNPMSTL